jgi:CheY-like chemotaxis protein/DNA-directed RNA polymerase subunit RPC12/RpoP
MLEIQCPACKAGYFVEERAAGAEFVCPSCTKAFLVPPLAPVAAAERRASSANGRRRAARSGSTAKAVRVPARTAARPESKQVPEQREVVCPRCNLHFLPKTERALARKETRPTVLVVEEPGFFLNIAQEALTAEYEVLTASSVEQAQALLSGDTVDLLVLNLGVEGPESGRELLPGPFAKRCPILIYSADDESDTFGARWEELQGLGADDIVIKGMSVAESLSRKVGVLLGRPAEDGEDNA